MHTFLQSIQQRINAAATKAQTYLESQMSVMTDDYVLAIASYALKLAHSSMFTTAFTKLNNDAIIRGKNLAKTTEYWFFRVCVYFGNILYITSSFGK